MTDSGRRTAGTSGNADWLSRVADEAAGEAGVPVALLGEYLQILAVAAMEGRQPSTDQLAALRGQGRRVAEEGVGADRAVDLFLSAAWRLWRAVPTATVGEDSRRAAETLLRVVNQAVEVLVDGHQAARREMIRREESTRRELVDDLLRGDADVARLVRRAQPFGLDLGRFHRVVLAEPSASSRARPDRAAGPMEREVVDRYGDREVMVATKDDFVVLILPAGPAGEQLSPTTARSPTSSPTGSAGTPARRLASCRGPGPRRRVRDRDVVRGGAGGARARSPVAPGRRHRPVP